MRLAARRGRCAGGSSNSLGAGGHPLDEQRQVEDARQHEVGVERREGGLQAGRAHRRLLEGHLLLVARVRGVVGRDAVDRAVAQPLDQRLAVGLGRERRVHLHARVHPAHVLLGEQQVVGRDLGADAPALRLGVRDGVDRGGAAEVLEVHARVLVAGERGVARDHRGLADRGDAADAQRGADGALVLLPPRERRVLLVQRDDAAAQPLVLQRLAQHPGALHRLPSSVKPTAPSSRSSAISVSCSPCRPRVIEGRKPIDMRASRAAVSRSERSSGAESSTGSVLGIASTAA